MDWFVLLAGLILLPLVWSPVFVGCSLEQTGSATPTQTRLLILHYDIPMLGKYPVSTITVTFTVWSSDTSMQPLASFGESVAFDSTGRAQKTFPPKTVDLFDDGEPIWCRCHVDLVRQTPWGSPTEPVMPIDPLEAETAEPTKNAIVEFTLTYAGWLEEKDYTNANFHLSFNA